MFGDGEKSSRMFPTHFDILHERSGQTDTALRHRLRYA